MKSLILLLCRPSLYLRLSPGPHRPFWGRLPYSKLSPGTYTDLRPVRFSPPSRKTRLRISTSPHRPPTSRTSSDPPVSRPSALHLEPLTLTVPPDPSLVMKKRTTEVPPVPNKTCRPFCTVVNPTHLHGLECLDINTRTLRHIPATHPRRTTAPGPPTTFSGPLFTVPDYIPSPSS